MPYSGKHLCSLFEAAGWKFLRQNGTSHRMYGYGTMNETIPMHEELATGTEKAVIKSLKKSLEGREYPKKLQKLLKNKKL